MFSQYLTKNLFWSYEKLTIIVQNVVNLHTHSHTRCQSPFPFADVTFCCRQPGVNKLLLQLIDAIKLFPVHSRPEIATK